MPLTLRPAAVSPDKIVTRYSPNRPHRWTRKPWGAVIARRRSALCVVLGVALLTVAVPGRAQAASYPTVTATQWASGVWTGTCYASLNGDPRWAATFHAFTTTDPTGVDRWPTIQATISDWRKPNGAATGATIGAQRIQYARTTPTAQWFAGPINLFGLFPGRPDAYGAWSSTTNLPSINGPYPYPDAWPAKPYYNPNTRLYLVETYLLQVDFNSDRKVDCGVYFNWGASGTYV